MLLSVVDWKPTDVSKDIATSVLKVGVWAKQ
jgi:hypothetical protein